MSNSAEPRRLAVLGSTGSIGRQALEVAASVSSQLRVVLLAGGSNLDLLADQCHAFRPPSVWVPTSEGAKALADRLEALPTEVCCGRETLESAVGGLNVDVVLVAIPGFASLRPTLAAVRAGKHIALASKEALVAGGHLVMSEVARSGACLIPVDSEHSSLYRLLRGQDGQRVRRIFLTASGGPFRTWPAGRINKATPEQALDHPTWKMGTKVTIDSASLMNKGLEVIEAHWLFGYDVGNIQVVIHPQSIVHGAVELQDGTLMAHLGPADMRVPIQYSLIGGEAPSELWSFALQGELTFEPPDPDRFPCLRLARWAGEEGGTLPTVLSAANEVAVQAFVDGCVPFGAIPRAIEAALGGHRKVDEPTLDQIEAADVEARAAAREGLTAFATRGAPG